MAQNDRLLAEALAWSRSVLSGRQLVIVLRRSPDMALYRWRFDLRGAAELAAELSAPPVFDPLDICSL